MALEVKEVRKCFCVCWVVVFISSATRRDATTAAAAAALATLSFFVRSFTFPLGISLNIGSHGSMPGNVCT